jgi:predicted acetyltransferase
MVHLVKRCNMDDKDTIWNIISYAYSIPESSKEKFFERLEIMVKEFFLNEVDGAPEVTARVLQLDQNIRGVLKPMGGIGMVASSPEHRRMGNTRDLILSIFDILKKEGYAVSTLYPFKDTFYGSLGYVKMPPTRTLEFNPNALVGISVPIGYSAKREEGEEMLKVRRKLHRDMVLETHGGVIRSDMRWEEMTKNFSLKAVVTRNSKGNPEGIMIYSIKGYGEGHSWAETGQLSIHEFIWLTLEARDALLNYLYKHADQIVKVTMLISARNEDFYHWLSNIYAPTMKANIVSMARIIDVAKSLSGYPSVSSGRALIKVIDPQIEENNKVFEISSKEGLTTVEESKKQSSTTIRIEGLTSILYGTLNEDQLRRMGWLSGESPSNLFNWFPPAVPWLTEDF